MNAWSGFRSIFQPQLPVSVRKEMLWFNENILVQKRPIFYQKWYEKGIKFINDIVDENGEFLTLEQMNVNYNFQPNFSEYLRIHSAIPYNWKQILKSQNNITLRNVSLRFCIKGKFKNIEELQCKDIYWILVEHGSIAEPTCIRKWTETFV